jgi:hypothetical protein
MDFNLALLKNFAEICANIVSQDLWDNVQTKIIMRILSLHEEYSRLVHILQN